jgi:hypothetical protein
MTRIDHEWFVSRGIDPDDPEAMAYKAAVQRGGNVGSFKAWKQKKQA